jgi:hypothetical protein
VVPWRFPFLVFVWFVLGFREPGIFALDDLALLLGFLLIAGGFRRFMTK